MWLPLVKVNVFTVVTEDGLSGFIQNCMRLVRTMLLSTSKR